MVSHHFDAKGLLCPLPVLRARKAMKPLAVGEVLEIEATDAAAPVDFAAFCRATGYRLLKSDLSDGVYRVAIEKTQAERQGGG